MNAAETEQDRERLTARPSISRAFVGRSPRILRAYELLKMNSPSRAVTLEVVQGLTDTSHRNISQLSRQLLSSIDIQRLAMTETLHAIEMLGVSTLTRLDEHRAELTTEWRSARQRVEERLYQELSASFENVCNLNREGIRRLEKIIIVASSQNSESVKAVVLEQGEQLRNLIAEHHRALQANHAACIQSFGDLNLGLLKQQDRFEEFKSELNANQRQHKKLLYCVLVMMFAILGALSYIIFQSH
jgi:hypothetical protein